MLLNFLTNNSKSIKYDIIDYHSFIQNKIYKKGKIKSESKIDNDVLLECFESFDVEHLPCGFDGLRDNEWSTFWSKVYKRLQLGKSEYAMVIDFSNIWDQIHPLYVSKKLYNFEILDDHTSKLWVKKYKHRGLYQFGKSYWYIHHILMFEFDNWLYTQWMNNPNLYKYSTRIYKNGVIDTSNGKRALRCSSKLKEFYYYRYKTQAIIMARDGEVLEKLKYAVVKWFKKRVCNDVNLSIFKYEYLLKNSIDLLGYNIRLKKVNGKNKVYSKVNRDLEKYYTTYFTKSLKRISKSHKNYDNFVDLYNYRASSFHNYYCHCTQISLMGRKLSQISEYILNRNVNNRFHSIVRKGDIDDKYKKYIKSKATRYLASSKQMIIPVGYVSFKKPFCYC